MILSSFDSNYVHQNDLDACPGPGKTWCKWFGKKSLCTIQVFLRPKCLRVAYIKAKLVRKLCLLLVNLRILSSIRFAQQTTGATNGFEYRLEFTENYILAKIYWTWHSTRCSRNQRHTRGSGAVPASNLSGVLLLSRATDDEKMVL